MKIISLNNLSTFLNELNMLFGSKEKADKARNAIDTYILNIDYTELKFNTDLIAGDNSPYVGSAVVGYTYLA